MARPTESRLTRRVQVSTSSSPEGVGVYAPVDVRAAPSKGALGLASLSQALGMAAQIGAPISRASLEGDKQQGIADAQMGKVDAQRQASDNPYAEGVYEANVLAHFNDAAEKVQARAAQELDHSLPADQQVAQIDKWMKEELGGLAADDPRARRLIADRYQGFIQKATDSIVQNQVQQQVQLTVDTTASDVMNDLKDGGTGRYEESVDRIYRTTGDRNAAVTTVVGAYAQAALDAAASAPLDKAQGEVSRILGSIPTSITTSDGKSVPGPMFSPKHRENLRQVEMQAARVISERTKAEAAKHQFDTLYRYENMLNKDVQIPTNQVKADVQRGWLTTEQGISIIKRGWEKQKSAQTGDALSAGLFVGGARWTSLVGLKLPDGKVFNKERAQLLFNDFVAKHAPEGHLVDFALQNSARQNLPYEPLKTTLSTITPANPDAVLADNPQTGMSNLDLYRQMKAAGVAGMYLTDDAAAMFDYAATMQDANLDKKTIADRLHRYDPKQYAEHVVDGMKTVKQNLDSVMVEDRFGPWNVNVSGLANKAYAENQLERQAKLRLGQGMSPEDALKGSSARLLETHFVADVGGNKYLLPTQPGLDPEHVNGGMKILHDVLLPQADKEHHLADGEARIEILPGDGGRGVEINITDRDGNLLNPRPWTLGDLSNLYVQQVKKDIHEKDQQMRAKLHWLDNRLSKDTPEDLRAVLLIGK